MIAKSQDWNFDSLLIKLYNSCKSSIFLFFYREYLKSWIQFTIGSYHTLALHLHGHVLSSVLLSAVFSMFAFWESPKAHFGKVNDPNAPNVEHPFHFIWIYQSSVISSFVEKPHVARINYRSNTHSSSFLLLSALPVSTGYFLLSTT